MDYKIFLYIFFGILPSLTWLFYYLRKDIHPEPKKMVLKIFLWGALVTLPVFFIQIGFTYLLAMANLDDILHNLIYWFLIIAFSEEFFKYLVIRSKIINNPALDEPLDLMLYMVIAALGFSALENILYLFAPAGTIPFEMLLNRVIIISVVRFIGATFLHTLCSALVGYFFAVSLLCKKRKFLTVIFGIGMATLLHGLYDFSIMTLDGYLRFSFPVIILLILALFVFSGFERLKNMKSICIN